jgi:hypothetical protein
MANPASANIESRANARLKSAIAPKKSPRRDALRPAR